MQIVIELSDEIYKNIKEENSIYGINNGLSARITGKVVGAIQNGTPLPKGHGRLIDADALNRKDVNCANVPMNFIDTAPTIIKADKTESRGRKTYEQF